MAVRDTVSPSVSPLSCEGLIYMPNFLSEEEGKTLMSRIDANGTWFEGMISRRVQCYGIHYYFTKVHNPGECMQAHTP